METVTQYRCRIPLVDYIKRFRNVEKFIPFCKECKNFGQSWYCPPFDADTSMFFREYNTIEIIVFEVHLPSPDITLADGYEYLNPIRTACGSILLKEEEEKHGRAFSFAGHCIYCGNNPCSRLTGEACRHPEKVRPSLEAYGFDLEATLSELFGLSMQWGKKGMMPQTLHLIAAVAF